MQPQTKIDRRRMMNVPQVRTALLFSLLLATQAAFAGGPDVRVKQAMVEKVSTDNHRIIMIVSGQCELFLTDSSLSEEQGNARMVVTDMDQCIVTIVRRDQPGSGYKNWNLHCQKAEALEGKLAWIDLLQGVVTIDRARVAAVRAEASVFALRDGQENK